eukprot:249734-Rhodomonas_salina.4
MSEQRVVANVELRKGIQDVGDRLPWTPKPQAVRKCRRRRQRVRERCDEACVGRSIRDWFRFARSVDTNLGVTLGDRERLRDLRHALEQSWVFDPVLRKRVDNVGHVLWRVLDVGNLDCNLSTASSALNAGV